jgi:hypothetical protein
LTTEVVGKVTKVGRVKDYGHETNWGRNWETIPKFFLEIVDKEGTEYKAMVACKAEQSEWGLRIPQDAERQKPFVGDTVKVTTHRIQNGWVSVTWNQTYEIIKENKKARKERDEWVAKKKQEREDEFKAKKEEIKQNRLDLTLEQLGHLETQKYDERLPEAVRDQISSTFDFDTILKLLRDTAWYTVAEGQGGKQAIYDLNTGHMLEDGYPGTGLRRPGACLHGHPESVRKSILKKAMDSGLIIKEGKGYKATKLGKRTLRKIDTCPECGELRHPVDVTNVIVYQRSSKRYPLGKRYMCSCEIKAQSGMKGSNTGLIIREYKFIEQKRKWIMEA